MIDCVCVCVCTCVSICTCVSTCVYTYVRACACVCACVRVSLCHEQMVAQNLPLASRPRRWSSSRPPASFFFPSFLLLLEAPLDMTTLASSPASPTVHTHIHTQTHTHTHTHTHTLTQSCHKTTLAFSRASPTVLIRDTHPHSREYRHLSGRPSLERPALRIHSAGLHRCVSVCVRTRHWMSKVTSFRTHGC